MSEQNSGQNSGQNPGQDAGQDAPKEHEQSRGRGLAPWAWVTLAVVLVAVVVLTVWQPSFLSPESDDQSATQRRADFTTSLAAAGYRDGLSVNGLPGSAGFAVPVPTDATPHDLRLRLTGTTFVATDAFAWVTITAGGQPVHAWRPEAGEQPFSLDVALPDGAAAGGSVRVVVSTDGDGANPRCAVENDLGSLVRIDAASVIEGDLDGELSSVHDVAAVLHDHITVWLAPDVVDGRDDGLLATALDAGSALDAQGHDVEFRRAPERGLPEVATGDDVLVGPREAWAEAGVAFVDPEGSRTSGGLAVGRVGDDASVLVLSGAVPGIGALLSGSLSSTPTAARPAADDETRIDLARMGLVTDVAEVTDKWSWRIPYSLADLPQGRLPRAFEARLAMPAFGGDERLIAQVSLNKQVLSTVAVRPDRRGDGVVRVDLPRSLQRVRNLITVQILRDRDHGGCQQRVTPYPIQLSGGSGLILGTHGAGAMAVPAHLADGARVYFDRDGSTDMAATLTAAAPVLAELVPLGITLTATQDPTRTDVTVEQVAANAPEFRRWRIGDTRASGNDDEAGFVVARAARRNRTAGPALRLLVCGDPELSGVPAFGPERTRVITASALTDVAPADGLGVGARRSWAGWSP